MIRYVPLLKAKPGEWEAFGHLPAAITQAAFPIFEMCPDEKGDLARAVKNATSKAKKHLPPGSRVAVDCGFIDQAQNHGSTAVPIPLWIAAELSGSKIEMVPVARTTDSAAVLAKLGQTVKMHATPEAVLRVGDDDALPAPIPRADLAHVTGKLGLQVSQIHLVLDFRAIDSSRMVTAAAGTATNVIAWANGVGPWASITLASGAFPASVSGLAKAVPNAIQRWDADLWQQVANQGLIVGFGDYAVNHPGMPFGGRAPLPNLRYTDAKQWRVWREDKALPGNESFFTLCRRVVGHASYQGPGFSWGDNEISRCSKSIGGPGTATQWRAYGTSHHITTVVRRLATLGAP